MLEPDRVNTENEPTQGVTESPAIIPNKFSLAEYVNNSNDKEENNNPELNPLTRLKQAVYGEEKSSEQQNGDSDKYKENEAESAENGKKQQNQANNKPEETQNGNKAEAQGVDSKKTQPKLSLENSMTSPSSSRKYKIKTPTTPGIKTFFTSERPEGNQPSSPGNEETRWLKRISKFNQDPSFAEWKTNFLFFKNGTRNQTKTPKKPKPTLEKLSASDASARLRASFLIDSLFLGYTALNLVSSVFLLDEQNTRRAPLLAHLVGISILDVTETDVNATGAALIISKSTFGLGKTPAKRRRYRFELEYGIGPQRARWTLIKSYKEILNFSVKLKLLHSGALGLKKGGRPTIPRFPRLKDKEADSDEDVLEDEAYEIIDVDRALSPSRDRRSSISSNSSSINRGQENGVAPLTRVLTANSITSHFQNLITRILNLSREKRQRRKGTQEDYVKRLEHFFQRLFLDLLLRPQSNKLFQFLELSPIGVLLLTENGYKGKQGYLLIATSAKKQGWRVDHLKASDIGAMIKRHTTKWFCVRDSYIVYVADINLTTILDVFLVDEFFKVKHSGEVELEGFSDDEEVVETQHNGTPHVNITIENKERKLKLVAKLAHEMHLWVRLLQTMAARTEWSQPKRFGSFAPVRNNCFAKWFVDARDYWWAASSAIEMAKDVIFIHDWWLLPELYLRRPANGNQEWRLDRLLKRKAEQGVKIFVIIYRNIGDFVVIDLSWTKHSLMDLHDNIRVLRLPNQFLQNTFFWAHHEKLLIIDHTVAFLGGIDLCYGRYDTPDHVLVDDAPLAFDDGLHKRSKYQVFPGKDYSNPRVKDFFELDKPYESMYDRSQTPRMPWHDVHSVHAGQIARDLLRHFVQRWNYLIRQKRPSRPTPLLTPPPALTAQEIEDLGLKGTCEVQLLRSSGYWSLGLKEVEHSIQNAYLKIIETSSHFVYLENQFFVTASAWDNVVIENRIGDALVDRIIRAHKEGTKWKAVIVIPLMPGFEAQVDEPEGSLVRVIMQCQYMSILRGLTSIYAKLRKAGIVPEHYIQFFSLRKWGRIGPNGKLVSEQLYIHAKTIMADDRIAIIGLANINERLMRGSRDLEICAIVRDTETVQTTMDGKPYQAAKFAHTLRMRLMREHLGVDVDLLDLVERQFAEFEKVVDSGELATGIFADGSNLRRSALVELASREVLGLSDGTERWKRFKAAKKVHELSQSSSEPLYQSFNHRAWVENLGLREKKLFSTDPRIKNNKEHKADVEGHGSDHLNSEGYKKWHLNARETLKRWAAQAADSGRHQALFLPEFASIKEFLDNDDDLVADQGQPLSPEQEEILAQRDEERWEMLKRVAYLQRVAVKCERDLKEENAKRAKMGYAPKKSLFDVFKLETAEKIHESEKQEEKNLENSDIDTRGRSATSATGGSDNILPNASDTQSDVPIVLLTDEEIGGLFASEKIGRSRFVDPYSFSDPLDDDFYEDLWYETAYRNTKIFRMVFHCQPDDRVSTWKEYKKASRLQKAFSVAQDMAFAEREKTSIYSEDEEEEDAFAEDGLEQQKRPAVKRHGTLRSIRLDEMDNEGGVLGMPPELAINGESVQGEKGLSQQQQQRLQRIKNKLFKKFSNLRKGGVGDIQEENEDEDSLGEVPDANVRSPVAQVTCDSSSDGDLLETLKSSGGDKNTPMNGSKSVSKSSSFHDVSTFLSPTKGNISSPARSTGVMGLRRGRRGTFVNRRHKQAFRDDMIFDHETADRILSEITGHLVLFPVDWLSKELESNNWFTNSDRLPPIEIYD